MLSGHDDILLYIALQLAKVLNPAGSSARFSTVLDIPTFTSGWNDVNVLIRFVCASPSLKTEKKPFLEK